MKQNWERRLTEQGAGSQSASFMKQDTVEKVRTALPKFARLTSPDSRNPVQVRKRIEPTPFPAPGSALADDSPNVLSGRDRGFYDPDPPSPETVRQAWLWEMGLAQ